jgi:hypothetical protein
MIVAITALAAIGLVVALQCSSRLLEIVAVNPDALLQARGWLASAFLVLLGILILAILELATGHL